jgi:hypothetical protein
MTYSDWSRKIRQRFSVASNGSKVFGVLLLIAGLGLTNDAWQSMHRVWQEFRRPVAVYRRNIRNGVAISLNDLEQRIRVGDQLPAFDLRGVMLDRSRNDWILFGEENPARPPIPMDALAIAVQAIRLHLEAPGIDIRPDQNGHHDHGTSQQVQYFGGVAGTVVGMWFFRFDYWMKRTSLGQESVQIPGMTAYWHRSVEALEGEIKTCDGTRDGQWIRSNRYWLCADEFEAIEGNNTLAFQRTPLRVLAESLSGRGGSAPAGKSPCTSRGTDDPLATEFANQLTKHLADLTRIVPVFEIEDFAKLMAGFMWLTEQDPYRDLRPWLNAALVPVETPTEASTLSMQATREHSVMKLGTSSIHQHRLELSGGVLVAPSLSRARAGDNSLWLLQQAVFAARPAGNPVAWNFAFTAPSI